MQGDLRLTGISAGSLLVDREDCLRGEGGSPRTLESLGDYATGNFLERQPLFVPKAKNQVREFELGFRKRRGKQCPRPIDARNLNIFSVLSVTPEENYSTVTLLARLRGWSTSVPRIVATW